MLWESEKEREALQGGRIQFECVCYVDDEKDYALMEVAL